MNPPHAPVALRARLPMLAAFALALGLWDAVSMVKLRLLLGVPAGAPLIDGSLAAFVEALRSRWPQLLIVEQTRQAATLLIFVGLALAAGRRKSERLAFFLLTFSMAKLFYLIWLRLLADFPTSLAAREPLWWVPLVEFWVRPVWVGVLGAIAALVVGMLLLWLPQFGHSPRGLLTMVEGLDERSVRRDPIEQFAAWYDEARRLGQPEPEAMTLATATPDGAPAARMVLLKGHGPEGFEFYTNYESRKGLELEANPRAALVFWWPHLRRQVRVEGRVAKLDPARSDAYFASRLRGSRLGAWASDQSRPIPSRDALEQKMRRVSRQFEGRDVPRPPYWGGYRVVPTLIEFWQERPNRLHDRLQFYRSAPGEPWTLERLQP